MILSPRAFFSATTTILALGFSSFAAASHRPIPRLGSGERLVPGEISTLQDEEFYQLGDEWGKRPVTVSDLGKSPVFDRAAKATARVDQASGFYLGEFAGKHIVATNHHVCPEREDCVGLDVEFPLLGISVRTTDFLGSWPAVDLALLVVEADDRQAAALADVAGNFAFDAVLAPGDPLLTIGFGYAGNPLNELVANQDADCKVFSASDAPRLMRDPDEINPGEYEAWSFANGCDVSHGDSGSAAVDRETGRIVGILWTGRIPKAPRVQNSGYLDRLLAHEDPEIWTELTYAVPAAKIGEYLRGFAQDESYPAEHRAVFADLVD